MAGFWFGMWVFLFGLLTVVSFQDHSYGWSVLCLVAALAIIAIYVSVKIAIKRPRQYSYRTFNCPNKNKQPEFGMLKQGFVVRSVLTPDDDARCVAYCDDCGYEEVYDVNPRAVRAYGHVNFYRPHP